MVELTELQKLKEGYPEFFKRTPPEIIDLALSEKTSEKIADIAVKNGITDEEKIEGIAQRITWVILGKLPSGNLPIALELWVGLSPETAKKIADESNQFISSAMAQLKSDKLPKQKEVIVEKPKNPPSKDAYREPVE